MHGTCDVRRAAADTHGNGRGVRCARRPAQMAPIAAPVHPAADRMHMHARRNTARWRHGDGGRATAVCCDRQGGKRGPWSAGRQEGGSTGGFCVPGYRFDPPPVEGCTGPRAHRSKGARSGVAVRHMCGAQPASRGMQAARAAGTAGTAGAVLAIQGGVRATEGEPDGQTADTAASCRRCPVHEAVGDRLQGAQQGDMVDKVVVNGAGRPRRVGRATAAGRARTERQKEPGQFRSHRRAQRAWKPTPRLSHDTTGGGGQDGARQGQAQCSTGLDLPGWGC